MSRTLQLVSYPPGKKIPGTVYRVVAGIGKGGMGIVYEVEDTSVGRRYALKTLLSSEGNLGDVTTRLVREARLTAGLRHRNIVEVITAGKTSDEPPLPYYVMELLQGIPLRGLMKNRAVRLDHVHQIGTELLDGLYRAHHPVSAREKPLVHCDLKPENIFLALDLAGKSTVKILDFGIAAAVGPRTSGRGFAGTPKYAAPEQFAGGPTTPQTDLYAVGCVLYEMIAGVGPFPRARTAMEYARAHTSERPAPLGDRVKLPPEVERVILSALAKDPAARPRDAYAFMVGIDPLRWIDAAVLPADANKTDEMLETAVTALGLSPSSSPLVFSSTGPSELPSEPTNEFAATKPSPGNEGGTPTRAPARRTVEESDLAFDREAQAQSLEIALSRAGSGSVDRGAATVTSPAAARAAPSGFTHTNGTERLPRRATPVPAAGRRADGTLVERTPANATAPLVVDEAPAPRIDHAMTEVDGTPWFQSEESVRAGARRRAVLAAIGVAGVLALLAAGVRVAGQTATTDHGVPSASSVDGGATAATSGGAVTRGTP
jgi:serine/threonine protein kinase